jgi:hypothetical protein
MAGRRIRGDAPEAPPSRGCRILRALGAPPASEWRLAVVSSALRLRSPLAMQMNSGATQTLVGVLTVLAACGGRPASSASGSLDGGADLGTGGHDVGATGSGGSGGAGGTGGVGGRVGSGGRDGAGGAVRGTGGALAASTCPGYAVPGSWLCRSSADCPAPNPLCTPRPTQSCGFSAPPNHLCLSDANCAAGQSCGPVGPKQPCAMDPDFICYMPCTATSCGVGKRCGTNGLCETAPCNEGSTCPAGSHCEVGAANADPLGCAPDSCAAGAWTCGANQRCQPPGDAHGCRCTSDAACPLNQRCNTTLANIGFGCVTLTCASDADCDCGVCIGGGCQPGLWACQLMVP